MDVNFQCADAIEDDIELNDTNEKFTGFLFTK